MRRLAILAALGLLFHSPALAIAQTEPQEAQVDSVGWDNTLDAVVVTATRTEVSLKELGSSVTVISGSDIDRSQQTTVLDALRATPGLDIVQSGGAGKLTSLFLRGSDAGHTLVLIDGVEMNDPVSVGRTYNFSDLPVDNIDRIEVLRGPQGTLYGSDAIAGVVNIVTGKGRGRPSMRISTMGGSLETVRTYGRVAGGNGQYHYSMGLSWFRVGGISAASESQGNTENDSYRNATVSGRVGYTRNDRLGLDLVFRGIDAAADIDNGGGVGQDDPNNRQDSRQIFVRPELSLKLWDRRWQQTFGYSFSDHNRGNMNPTDAAHPVDSSESAFRGRIHQFNWQSTLHFHENSTLTFGAETEEEQGSSTFRSDGAFGPFESIFGAQTARISGYYVQDQFQYQNMIFVTAGVRLDDHSIYGNMGTYRVAPVIYVAKTGTRLKGSYGTGFKAPSLFQLYSSFGNPTLRPGESRGWDAGVEQYGWQERAGFGVTYFRNDFTDLIDFDNNTFTYNNITSARTQGVEWFGFIAPSPRARLRLNYTYTDAKDRTSGLALLRRPRHKWNMNADCDVNTNTSVHVDFRIVGKRGDSDFSTFPAARVTLDRYEVVNLAASYRLMPALRLTARVDNLLNKQYEEVLGFGTVGVAGYAGIALSR